MTPDDVALLRQAFRAARAKGWSRDHLGPCGREPGTRYWVDDRDTHIGLTRDHYLETPISGTDCYSVEMAVDHLAGVGVLPIELHSAYRRGIDSIPWQYCVQRDDEMREFETFEEAAAWAEPTDEGHPKLPLLRQRRGTWQVAS